MPKPKDARRLIPDPDNEPDFYAISKAFPLPDSTNASPKEERQRSENGFSKSGTSRPASDSVQSNSLPPVSKRQRLVDPNSKIAGHSARLGNVAPADSSTNDGRISMPTSMTPTLAASLLAATASGSSTVNASPTPVATTGTAASNALGLNWAALRSPQLQVAADRNTALLQALRAGLATQAAPHPQPPPQPSSNDLAASLVAALGRISAAPQAQSTPQTQANSAATLAAALIRQVMNDSEGNMNDPNSALASLTALVRGQL